MNFIAVYLKKMSNKPRIQVEPQKDNKSPRVFIKKNGENIFTWAVMSNFIDVSDDYWGFNMKKLRIFYGKIWSKLNHYNSMTWDQIRGCRHNHPMDINVLSKDFISRINTIFGENSPETLWQLDIDGKHRIWGCRVENVFYVMFDDQQHKGYPVEKKHSH